MMQKRVAVCAIAMSALAACSGSGVNETAASTTYNAVYAGPATLTPISGSTVYTPVALTATLTMSQLAATVTGTIVVTASSSVKQDTVLAAGVTGHTTSDGLDLTVVQPLGCAIHMNGPLTLESDGSLSGTLIGSDCNANGTSDLRLDLTLAHR